jgi:hypothetical protein
MRFVLEHDSAQGGVCCFSGCYNFLLGFRSRRVFAFFLLTFVNLSINVHETCLSLSVCNLRFVFDAKGSRISEGRNPQAIEETTPVRLSSARVLCYCYCGIFGTPFWFLTVSPQASTLIF